VEGVSEREEGSEKDGRRRCHGAERACVRGSPSFFLARGHAHATPHAWARSQRRPRTRQQRTRSRRLPHTLKLTVSWMRPKSTRGRAVAAARSAALISDATYVLRRGGATPAALSAGAAVAMAGLTSGRRGGSAGCGRREEEDATAATGAGRPRDAAGARIRRKAQERLYFSKGVARTMGVRVRGGRTLVEGGGVAHALPARKEEKRKNVCVSERALGRSLQQNKF
jgi:hypothetical protein